MVGKVEGRLNDPSEDLGLKGLKSLGVKELGTTPFFQTIYLRRLQNNMVHKEFIF